MFSFFSNQATATDAETTSKPLTAPEEAEEIEVELEEEQITLGWVPPYLEPEDVTCLINVISGCSRRGAFKIHEYDVILPVFKKLYSSTLDYPEKFQVAKHEEQEQQEQEEAVAATEKKQNKAATKNNKKKHKKKRR